MAKIIVLDGLRFTRDERTGYYLNSKNRKLMHRYIWEKKHGEIPKGYHIHHIDGIKTNNDINNLEALSASEHMTYHGKKQAEENYEKMVENLEKNARPKAAEWHGSEQGIEWHKKQSKYINAWSANKVERICLCCSEKYMTVDRDEPKFCSNKCKSKYRRDSGLDNVDRSCVVCENTFSINKYYKTTTCSRNCTTALKRRNKDVK